MESSGFGQHQSDEESVHERTEDGATLGVDVGDGSAGGTPYPSGDAEETSTTAPEEAVTPQGGVGNISEEGGEQLATEREVIVGEQGVGTEEAADQLAQASGSFDPNAPRATSAPPAGAQSGVPNLPENEGVEPGEQGQPVQPEDDENE